MFAVVLMHTMTNLAWIGPFLDFGSGGYSDDAMRISALIMAVAAAIVTVAWGPRTLAGYSKPSRVGPRRVGVPISLAVGAPGRACRS